MKLIIGLGNPGTKYIRNRHNAGHLLIDAISEGLKTNTFMNDSGKFVKKNKPKDLNDLYIAHDDLDIRLGQYKIQFGVGPKVHNGIKSVEEVLNTKDFWRIRIGIDNREDAIASLQHDTGADYVLSDFTKEELDILDQVYAKIRDDLAKI